VGCVLGPITRAQGKGLTILDIAALIAFLITAARVAMGLLPRLVTRFSPRGLLAFGWLVGAAVFALTFLIGGLLVLLPLMCALNGAFGLTPLIGLTLEHYNTVWVDREFWRNFLTSLKVTVGVVTISLTFGTLAGYALARSGSTLVLDGSDQTMVPAIAGYFNRETTTTDQVQADAAAVSITAPLFLLVMTFQRQIVSGLTAGAVKG